MDDGTGMEGRRAVERRIVSVLFADLVGFTALTERLDPEDTAAVQDAYFEAARDTLVRYGGAVEKFIGDAVMAVFGLARARDDDAERAVRAGLALVGAIEQLGARVGLEPGDLALRVGVTTGEVAHAAGGPEAGRVTGDPVNTAARLQAAAAPGSVLIDETAALSVAEAIETRTVGELELKGRSARMRAFVAIAPRPSRSRDLAMGGLRAPLVGRDAEVRRLDDALARAAAGSAERWLVVAPPGVGKSRLLDEFARRAMARVRRVVAWRIRLRPEEVGPYTGVAALALEALSGADPALAAGSPLLERPVLIASLTALLGSRGAGAIRGPVLAGRLADLLRPASGGPSERPSAAGPEERSRLFADWLAALDVLAGPATQLWLIEDVHWTGGDLRAFVDGAVAEAPGSGRLVVATARPSLLEADPVWCDHRPADRRHRMRLDTLQSRSAVRLVRELVGDALPDLLVARIAERSDGNPLFIEELLRTWVSVGILAPAEGVWRLAVPAADAPLPTTVQAIYSAQLDDLPPPSRAAARRAAVAGRRFPVDSLDALGVPEPADALEVLRRREIVGARRADPIAGETLAYRHALLRDAGYASLARTERARCHVLLARWLEAAAGDRRSEVAETIGAHYASALEAASPLSDQVAEGLDRAALAQRAAIWFELAGDAALGVVAHDAARTLYTRSLDLTPEEDLAIRARRLDRLGEAIALAADYDQAVATFGLALEAGRRAMADAPDPNQRAIARSIVARAAESLGTLQVEQLRFAEARQLADEVLELIVDGRDVEAVRLRSLRAEAGAALGERVDSLRDATLALEIARELGDRTTELAALSRYIGVRSETGAATAADWVELEQLAAATGDWQRALAGLTNQGMYLLDDEAAAVFPLTDRAAELAEARGLTEDLAWVDYLRTEAAFVMGDWDSALSSGRRALEVGERNAYHRLVVRTWHAVVPIAAARGDRGELAHAAAWYAAREGHFPDSPYGRLMRGAVDIRLAAAGLAPPPALSAERLAASFSDPSGPSYLDAVITVVGAWIEAGALGAARETLASLDAAVAVAKTRSRLAQASVALLRAWVLHTAGAPRGEVADTARTGLDLSRRSAAPWWQLRSLRVLAAAGAATASEVAEARSIERSLRIVDPG